MTDMIKSNEMELTRTWVTVAVLIVAAGIFISSFKLFTPYSYWLDELFSVNASALHWGELHKKLLSDVHPPLYQVILKVWMNIFSDTEPATRVLSAVFAIGSFFVALSFASKQGGVFFYCVAVCFSSNYLFTFYANETRSYAMTLFLSTLLLTLFPFNKNKEVTKSFFITAVLLSLTHYFGLILAGLSLAIIFFLNLKNFGVLVRTIAVGLVCLVWPIHHILNGSLASKTGGSFWIKVGSPFETVIVASNSMIPVLGKIGAVIFLGSLIVGGAFCFINKSKARSQEIGEIGFICASIVLFIVCLMAFVDNYTPMSTNRNYIVIMPASVFALAATAQLIAQNNEKKKRVFLILVTLYSCLALLNSYNKVLGKSKASQDWKNAVAIANSEATSRKLYYYTSEGIVDHYFQKYKISPSELNKYAPRETVLNNPSVIIYGHLSEDKFSEFQRDMRSLNARHVFPAESYRTNGHSGVFVID